MFPSYLTFSDTLVSQPFGPILEINQATIGETIFIENMLHDTVVPMGINPNILTDFFTPVENRLGQSGYIAGTGHPMNGNVRFII
jgi:hypothetical protein